MRMPAHHPASDNREATTQLTPRNEPPSPHGNHDKSDRAGRITSLIALLLALVIVVMSVASITMPLLLSSGGETIDYEKLLMSMTCGLGAILLSLALMVPTVLLALRSASKPKGHVGRGRGLFSVIASVTLPVLCLGLWGMLALGHVQSAMTSGVISKTVPDDAGNIKLVAPGSTVTISGGVASAMSDMGLLPESTIENDDPIPITAKDGNLYVGDKRLDAETIQNLMGSPEASPTITDKQIHDIAKQMENLGRLGYSMGIDGDGKLVATDPAGNAVTLSMDDDHNLSVDASTVIDLDEIGRLAEQFGISLDGLSLG